MFDDRHAASIPFELILRTMAVPPHLRTLAKHQQAPVDRPNTLVAMLRRAYTTNSSPVALWVLALHV